MTEYERQNPYSHYGNYLVESLSFVEKKHYLKKKYKRKRVGQNYTVGKCDSTN